MANFYDLDPTQTKSTDGKYVDLVFSNFKPDTDYGLTFAWVYEDSELGISEDSNIFNFKTIPEPDLVPPEFRYEDLDAVSTILYIRWTGKDATGMPYPEGKIKQVNIWIKGGDFGETYQQLGTSFSQAATIQINTTKSVVYCVKLQAESTSGQLSEFSAEQCIELIPPPDAPSNLRHEWDAAGNLTIYWKFNATLPNNQMADSFGVQLVDTTNDVDATWWTSVEPSKIPPLEQKIVISANQLQKVFGQYTAYEIDYDAFIYTRDRNLQTSFVTGYLLTKYSDPLTAPVITATTAPMAYQVAYTANAIFDQIYVEESLDGTTWTLVAVSPANPVLISTLNTVQRSVRARFSKKLGGFTGYSNTVTVTPTKIDPTDTTPPSIPSLSIGTTTYNTIPITITTSDNTTKGFRVRYKLSTESLYTTDIVIYSGLSTSYTIRNLTPSQTYNISVAAYDGANNLSDYSTTVNASTISTIVPVVSNITLSALSYGLYASWTAPSSPTVAIDNYKVELYNSSNTLLQTVYSFTTVTSFTGLKASTTYYIKVNAIDITGNSGTQVTSSNLTLNAAGGISDGSAPSSSPTPTVTALYQALEVKWTAISNADQVTYEVHVSSTPGFTPSSSTKALETLGTFAVIKTLPGTSTSLTYGTTYYVKIIAKDFDGSASASTQASAQTLQVDNGDLATNSVRANVIQAGTITSTQINADSLLVGKLFKVGAGASDTYAVKIDASGATTKLYSGAGIYSDAGTPFYLDTTGKFSLQDKLYFSGTALTVNGTINASAGNITGALTLNSGSMKIGANVNSTYDGIYIDSNNYWYSNGNFKVGGASNNISWNGTDFSVTGAIYATSGTITGNLNVTTGSIIAGSPTGARVTMSSTGIFAYDGSTTPVLTTSIIGNATAGGNTFTTTKALIGNWTVGTNTITGGGLTLNSTGSIIGTSGGSYIGIKPRQSAGTDIVLWSGNTQTPAINSAASGQAAFQVNADGQLYATGAIISGKITVEAGSSLGGLLNDTSKVYYSSTTPTAPSGGHKVGDGWVDTSNGNRLSIWNGTSWVLAQDSESVRSIAVSKNKTYYTTATSGAPTGVTGAVAGDLWINSSNGNKPYRYNGTTWELVQDSGAADGSTALSKAAKFGTDGSLISNLIIENSGAAIYSKYTSGTVIAKDSYSSTNAGFYMGWDNQAGVLYPAFNIGNANAYIKWSNYDQTLRIKGNISLNANSDINGTAASTVVSGSTAGASALQPGGNLTGSVDGTPVATIKSGATAGSSAVQPGNGIGLKNDGSKMVNQIDLLSSGIKISSASSGTRVEMSNTGLYLYKGSNTNPTVALDAATGDAQFTGIVNASGGSFSGNITASGTITGGTLSGATVTGGIIQTGSSNATRRIVMGSSQPDRIDFYPKIGDDADTSGYIWVSDDSGSATLPGLVIVPPTKSTWATPPKIKMTQTASGGLMDITAVLISMTGTVKFNTYAYHVGNVAASAVAHRNISAGNLAPSGGNIGDVYIQF